MNAVVAATPVLAPFDKRQVAAAFSRAASTYDAVAHLQRAVGESLWARANFAKVEMALDLGCGTGCFTPHLQTRATHVVGADLAFGMLDYTRQRLGIATPGLVQADAEGLPFADGAIDAIFSSLALQWCPSLETLAQSLGRVTAPGGQLAIATLGPRTLQELRAAFAEVDEHIHVNQFAPCDSLIGPLMDAGFEITQHAVELRQLWFDSTADLLRELKDLGATNMNRGRAQGLTARARLLQLAHAYEPLRTQQGLPATYEVVYLIARRRSTRGL